MDLDSLFKRAFDGFAIDPGPAEFPGVPGSSDVTGNDQPIASADISRCSRISRSGNRDIGGNDLKSENRDIFYVEDCAREDPFKSPGSTGTPGNGGKNPAESTSLQFPVKDREPGTPGTESCLCRQPIAPPGDPLPISPSDVRAGVGRELRALAEDGREGPGALRDAVEITRAKIRNSEALAERQVHGGRCHVCDGPLDDSAPVVAVLSGKRGSHLHLHAGCCPAYTARRIALVDQIMRSAGYGEGGKIGEAA